MRVNSCCRSIRLIFSIITTLLALFFLKKLLSPLFYSIFHYYSQITQVKEYMCHLPCLYNTFEGLWIILDVNYVSAQLSLSLSLYIIFITINRNTHICRDRYLVGKQCWCSWCLCRCFCFNLLLSLFDSFSINLNLITMDSYPLAPPIVEVRDPVGLSTLQVCRVGINNQRYGNNALLSNLLFLLSISPSSLTCGSLAQIQKLKKDLITPKLTEYSDRGQEVTCHWL